jgi:hypothetical protein
MGFCAVALGGCRAFDREQYRALLDGAVASDVAEAELDAADASVTGGCLAPAERDEAGCTLASVPRPLASLSDQPGNGTTYGLALSRIEIGPGSFGDWRRIGFDRDGRCSVLGASETSFSCRGMQPVLDGEDGRDNAFGAVIATSLFVSDVLRDATVNETLATGRLTHGLRITEWSGGDDGRVAVEWLSLVDGRAPSGAGPLGWDGRDVWRVEPSLSLTDDRSGPRTVADRASFACGVFSFGVAGALQITLPSRDRTRILQLRNVVVAGALSPDRGGTLDLSGVWHRDELLSAMPWFDACPPTGGDPSDYQARMMALLRALDLREPPSADRTANCNAASVAMRLTFVPARIDGVAPQPIVLRSACTGDGGA